MKIQGRLRTGDHVVAIATRDLLYMGKLTINFLYMPDMLMSIAEECPKRSDISFEIFI